MTEQNYKLPSEKTLTNASKLAIVNDRPIMMDYWTDSLDNKIIIGRRTTDENILVKNETEYTSPITKMYKSGEEYIILTENSIYLVSSDIPTRSIT